MRGRPRRLAIAVVLTIVDVAACNYFGHFIWQAFARDLFAKGALLGLLSIWVASATVIWLHVAYDLRQALRERDYRLALDAATASTEAGRNSNV